MTTPHTPAALPDVVAIEARAAAATPARERIAQRFGENTAVIQHATDVVIASAADVPTLLAALRTLAAEVAGARAATAAVNVARNADLAAFDEERAQHAADVAAAVAGETRRCIDACKHVASQCPAEDDRDLALTCAEAIEVDAPTGGA